MSDPKKKCTDATIATVTGAAVGAVGAKTVGATAVGVLANGAGWGAAAGPVGAAICAVGGLTIYTAIESGLVDSVGECVSDGIDSVRDWLSW